jgi:hypothetical protein
MPPAPLPARRAGAHETTATRESTPAPRAIGAHAAATPAAAPGPAEDPTPVVSAMRALRRDGDAARASALLDDYLRQHPTGALAEEALALAIEAATVRGDARARVLAAQYVTRYPHGRFRPAAERALARQAP